MKRTYVYVDGEFVERKRGKDGRYHYIIPDIQPYKSMIDGRMITSRSEHRLHLKANNCIEVGNEDPAQHVKREQPKNTRLEVLRHQIANMTHAQANKLLERLRDEVRFTHDPHRRK
jgi:tRNA U34 5-carboxymethylaminomethyl modifying enzyme MnmG/GidA